MNVLDFAHLNKPDRGVGYITNFAADHWHNLGRDSVKLVYHLLMLLETIHSYFIIELRNGSGMTTTSD